MTIQVNTGNNINKQNGLNGAGSSTPYMSPTDKHFASGGSVFTAPGANKQSSSGSSGGWFTKAFTATTDSDGGSKDAGSNGAAADAGANQANAVAPKAKASATTAEAHIKAFTQKATTANTQAAKDGADIKNLTSQRDDAAAKASSADAQGNPFDGTGSGTGSANNISGIGAGDTPPPSGGATTGPTAHVKAAVIPGGGTTTTAPATTTPAATTPPASGSTGSAGSSGDQGQVDTLNSQIATKTNAQQQAIKDSASDVKHIKASYQAAIAPLKADGAQLDGKIQDAQSKTQDAKNWQTVGTTGTAVGGATTAAGTAMCATGYGASGGTLLVKVGAGATIASTGCTLKANAENTSAQNEQNDATNGKANLAAQEKVVVGTYAQALTKAQRKGI